MILILGLGLLSLALIYFEFFVPGGILGVLGGLFLLLSTLLFIWVHPQLYWVLLYLVVAVLLVVMVIRLALAAVKKRPSLYAAQDQEGFVAADFDPHLIGEVGEAVTNLSPSGHIEIKGMRYQAVSESVFIKKGDSVKIISGEGARYKVRKAHD